MILQEPVHASLPAEAIAEEWLIEVTDARKKYCRDLRRSLWYGVCDVADAMFRRQGSRAMLRAHEFWAVDGVSFQLRRGDSLGVLGKNGAGKSTLLKLITGQRSLSSGEIRTRGRIVALNELGLGFDPYLTGRENAYINAAVLGLSRRRFDALIEEIIDFSGIREFIDSAVQTYSTGMKARLGFSVATHLEPDILIVDEVLAVGDLDFRRKCVKHVLAYVRRGGSVLLVAHDPYLVQSICNRAIVLERGQVIFEGTGIEGVSFHFQLGHANQYTSIAEAAERALSDAAEEQDRGPQPLVEEAASSGEEALLPPIPFESRVDLTEERPVAIDRFDVLPEGGSALRTGRPAKVIMRFRSSVSMEANWGFTLCTADLHTNIASCVQGTNVPAMHIGPGEHTVCCRLPKLTLQPGVFAVRGGIAESGSFLPVAIRGYQDPPDFFTVEPAETSWTSNFHMDSSDLVVMEAEWLRSPL
jgi:ABC-type polysaccharide/polyol phosphate transport system ATPase subunit